MDHLYLILMVLLNMLLKKLETNSKLTFEIMSDLVTVIEFFLILPFLILLILNNLLKGKIY